GRAGESQAQGARLVRRPGDESHQRQGQPAGDQRDSETETGAGVTRRLAIAITGASGALYGVRLLEALRGTDVETHLVVTKSGPLTAFDELGLDLKSLKA